MKRTLVIGKESQDVEFIRQDGVTTLVWDGVSHSIDIMELEPGCFSILMDGRSVEVRLDPAKSPDPESHDVAQGFSLITVPKSAEPAK